jgi:hypothetical protein
MTEQVFDELLTWVTGVDDTPSDLVKHAGLNTYLVANGVTVRDSSEPARAIVLGGAKAVIEQSILRDVGFSHGEIVCIDRVAPVESEFLGANSIVWLDGLFPDTIGEEQIPPAEVLVCLAASRLFSDAFDTYRRLIRQLRPGSLVVIDFLHQPLIRQAAISALRDWVFAEWSRDSAAALASLKDLARLSVSVGTALQGSEVGLESSAPELGIHPGTYSAQRVLYEVFFPFWFKPGANEDDALRQMVWQLLYRSMDGTEDRVRAFAAANAIEVTAVLPITPDTNVLIGLVRTM